MCEHELRGEEAWAFLVNFLAAANARIAELEQHFEQAKDKIAMMGAEIVRLSEGAEQSETQCAAMRNCDNCNKWCMKQPNKSEFATLNRMDDCKFNNLSHWELSKKIKAALEEKP